MSKIIGNTVGTPNPRPDWNQTDETKADYIKNKPETVTIIDETSSDTQYPTAKAVYNAISNIDTSNDGNNDTSLNITQVEHIPLAGSTDVGKVIQYVGEETQEMSFLCITLNGFSENVVPPIDTFVYNQGDFAIGAVAYSASSATVAEVTSETEGKYYIYTDLKYIEVNLPDEYEEGVEYYTINYEEPNYYWKPIQSQLVSGENIKTINGQSILGEGDITIEGNLGEVDSVGVSLLTQILKQGVYNSDVSAEIQQLEDSDVIVRGDGDSTLEIDQEYNPESESAQSGIAVAQAISSKQEVLVSGENIKTINGQSILGSGDIAIGDCIKSITEDVYVYELNDGIYHIDGDTGATIYYDDKTDVGLQDGLFVVSSDDIDNVHTWIAIGRDSWWIRGNFVGTTVYYEDGYKATWGEAEKAENRVNNISDETSDYSYYPSVPAVKSYVENMIKKNGSGITEITEDTYAYDLPTGIYMIDGTDDGYCLYPDDEMNPPLVKGIAIITNSLEESYTYTWIFIGMDDGWLEVQYQGKSYFDGERYCREYIGVTEHDGNKRYNLTTPDNISPFYYPSTKAVVDYVEGKTQDKQNTLISGENIKTINGVSLLGSGNITIEGVNGAETPGIINVRDYGAMGDGVTDDTAAIQNAVADVSDYKMLMFPKGHYIVKPTANNQNLIKLTGLKNISIELNGSTLEIATNEYSHYNLFNLIDCENFVITNGTLKGDRLTHDYITISSTHEFGYGIFVGSSLTASENGTPSETLKCYGKISDCEIFDFTGDGIVTKNGMSPGKIEVINCEIHHCRRQGISVLDSDDIVIDGCYIHHIGNSDNINGASPKSGIDIEPASGTSNVNSVYIKNTTIEEISNDSIIAVTKYDFNELDNGKNEITKVYTTIQSITIENCRTGVLTIRCHQNTDINNLKYATINIKDCVLNHSICEVEYRSFCTINGIYTNCIINTHSDYNYSNKDLFISSSKLFNCTLNVSPKVTLRYIELYDSIVNGGTVYINEGSDATIRDCSNVTFINCLLDAVESLGTYKFIKCSFIKCDSYPGIRTVQFYNCYLDKRYIEGAKYINCIIANENANEISENASDAQSPSAKAVYEYGQSILTSLQGDLDNLATLVGGVE